MLRNWFSNFIKFFANKNTSWAFFGRSFLDTIVPKTSGYLTFVKSAKSKLKKITRRNLQYFVILNYGGVAIVGLDWWNISKSIKKGAVFFRSQTYKNQTQKSEISDICPKLKFNRPLPLYIPTIWLCLTYMFSHSTIG